MLRGRSFILIGPWDGVHAAAPYPVLPWGGTCLARRGCLSAERGRSPSAARGQVETIWKRAMFSDQTTGCEPGRFAVQCNATSPQFSSRWAKHQTPSSSKISNATYRGRPRRAGRFWSLKLGASLELGFWNLELVAAAYQTLANETGIG